MKKLHKIFSLIAVLLLTQACTDEFGEINSNPNAPEQVIGDLLLPSIIIDPANNMANFGWGGGNVVTQLTAVNNFVDFDRYNWGTESGTWNLFYQRLRDTENLLEVARQNGNESYEGVALVMRAWMTSILTDFWGDVPFGEAINAKDGNFTPVYDAQENIYNSILADLEQANTLLAKRNGAIGGDLLYGGDLLKWQKFANSLRVRYLMRLEKKRGGASVGAEIQSIVNSLPVFESNDDNAAIRYLSTAPNQWGLHTARVGSFDEKRMAQTAELRMKALNDPRLFVYYRPVDNPDTLQFYLGDLAALGSGATKFKDFFTSVYNNNPEDIKAYYNLFKGLPNGLSEGNAIDYNGSRQNQSRLGEILRELPDGVHMILMNYSELEFILAEAAQKGYISGEAETHYLNGVNAAFEFYDITPADSYFEQEGVKLSADNETALDQIATQKWMSLFMTGMEGWIDWRRTGKPAIIPGPDNVNNDQVPVRFIYPGEEQALNNDNWKNAVSRLGEDDINAKMWLLQE